ncbi:DUF4249 domain-containing protein [Pontibacter sp. E15-1]|uniref:DUF4249 domain-containing protein n=1 Tax=Pontibacter sp. E15-1 TaxID=2919918 RepID=UPI001F500EEC|nr:DUF4249 domain-containing protein [Pontibacter sp. E15-1]MCJ8164521.1 DUF4249 domain-containing protein [Pontibacter sp. E15-1]
MKQKHVLYLLPLLAALLYGCDLSKDIEVVLPEHTSQLVVEAYLEQGKPYRLAVQESASYFDEPTVPLVPDAEAFITHNGNRVKLEYKPKLDENTGFIYTHSSPVIMDGKPGDMFLLEVTDGKGRKVTGYTTVLPSVAIDTVEWRFNKNDEALLLTSFQDEAATRNFYRYMTHLDSLSSGSKQDIFSNDELTNGKRISFGSGYSYDPGDTVIVTLFNIEEQYYEFLRSTSGAKDANGNPFAQPSKVKSSVLGGMGIFTNLAYERKVVIIR